MRGSFVTLVIAGAFASAAHAADKPVIGPAPAWVKPVAAPAAPATADDAPVRVLLSDQQVSLETGRQTAYSEVALKIQTPQGLAAGNVSFPWRPETDVLTMHKLLIRRGGEVIDVLKSGQTFTVLRREQNLESATLDGVLTANIQPEGLQVGDVLEFAASVSSSDPTLKGHAEHMAGGWNGFPVSRAHLRIQWPTTLPVRLRQTAALPALKPVKAGAVTAVELSLDDVQPIAPPKGAPPRYGVGRLVEVTDFASWADLGALMAPLYTEAAVLPAQGPLRTELERIKSLSPDPEVRAEAALALVQDRVRYVALAMGAGGYVPADVETTWARRYGDCKGKTVLLLAMLHAMEIEAAPVAVSSFGDGMDVRLPMIGLFNHVLVRAVIAGRTYWLDGTRTGDTGLDRLTTPDFGWGLPLVAKDAALVRMTPPPLETPTNDTSIRIDATAGVAVPAPTRIETVLRGDEAIGTNAALANLFGEARDRALREYWTNQHDFITIKATKAGFDPKTGELRLIMEGEAKLDWSNGNYHTDGTNVGYRADFSRDAGPDRDAPFAVPYPYFTRSREVILLPKGAGEFRLGTGMDVDQTAGGIHYRRAATIAGGVFTIEKTERSVAAEFPARDAPAAQAALRMLADRPAAIRMPSGYKHTGKDIAAVRADVPTTSAGYVGRASLLIDQGLRNEALADYDKAVELDPGNVYAWSNRGITRVQVGDLVGAKSDLAKAETIDPEFVQNHIGRGMLADLEGRWPDSVAAYTTALQQEPGNSYAIRQRAEAYAKLGNLKRASVDMNSVVKNDPDDPSAYVVRGNFYLERGRFDEAITDFDRAAVLDPQNEWALANRGLSRIWKGQHDAGTADLDKVTAINPRNAVAFRARGLMAEQKGAHQDAIAAYTTSLEIEPNHSFTFGHRAFANRAAGRDEAALQDATAALKLAPRWIDLYLLRANILRAQGNKAGALREAESLTAAVPDEGHAHIVAANIYGALDKQAEAMKAFDRALAIKPGDLDFLTHRGIAYARSGDQARAEQDFAAARAKATEPMMLNNMCWSKATAGVALEAALKECDMALAMAPDIGGFIDSRGLALLRLGRLEEAITTYDRALAREPRMSSSLFGRAVAWARKGDKVKSASDVAAALLIDPNVRTQFESYGLTL